ncbi:MAG: hypothetical protein IJS96_00330 [Schwartzia sp.]|nr:hypothetical protein [Schwartzia sp. (in: firmicutes)]
MAKEQVAIGGITYKMPISQVLEKYGKPHRIEHGSTYYWGCDSLRVNTWSSAKGQTNYVTAVKVAARNGLETPDGVIVGMPDSVLNDVYGKADNVLEGDINGYTVYIYNSQGGGSLAFRVNKGVIKVIELAGFFS